MKREEFLLSLKEIFKSEGVKNFDKTILSNYLDQEKKNSVVSIVEREGGKLFFKAIKPWANIRNAVDFKKGISVKKILDKSGVTGFDRVVKSGELKGILYLFSEVLPIKKTLSREKIITLSSSYAKKILELYLDNQKKTSRYLAEDINEVSYLWPYSNISHNFSFLGLIVLFEGNLVRAGALDKERMGNFAAGFLRKNKSKFFSSKQPYLLHGDFAPHNIIYSDKVYFIDWDRAFLSFNSFIGESFDLADLYIASYKNPSWRKVLYKDSVSFRLCLIFHLLSKMNNIVTFSKRGEHKEFFNWCVGEFNKHVK
jgi:hypothetical protein